MTNTSGSLRNIGPGLLVIIALAGGCNSAGLSHYVSPRIEGRVIDSSSHLPVEDVLVRRLASDESYRSMNPPNAGANMENAPVVRTASDGRFVFDSKQGLAVFGKPAWHAVNLSFQRPGYEGYTATYLLADATNNVNGEPLVKAGDLLLLTLSP
jgi:hypothetical protein